PMCTECERRKQRYAEDPEYRARIQARNKASWDRHKDEIKARMRLRYATDPEYRTKILTRLDPLERRKQYLACKYGITLQQYGTLLKGQGGRCAICKKKPKNGVLYVDHCHRTGRIRGLLCRGCNLGIGHLKDDFRLTRAATAYLKRKTLPGR